MKSRNGWPRPKNLPRKIPKKWWPALIAPRAVPGYRPPTFWEWRSWVLGLGKYKRPVPPKPQPVTMFMFDDVNVRLIPLTAKAVAGYVDGRFRTWAQVLKGWPNAKKLPIAVFGQDNGDALDVEPGDASILQAPAWVKRQLANWSKGKHDVPRPVVYTSLSQAQQLVNQLSSHGLKFGQDYLLWTAHYTGTPHICSPKCGLGLKVTAHATQYTDHANNESLDETECSPEFFS